MREVTVKLPRYRYDAVMSGDAPFVLLGPDMLVQRGDVIFSREDG